MVQRISRHSLVLTSLVALATLVPLAPGTPAAAASRLCGPPADTVAPQVSNVTFNTDAVDVTNGPASVTVTARATDTATSSAGSGVKRVIVGVGSRHGFAFARLHLLNGNRTDGHWQGTLTIPHDARPGTWQLREVDVSDTDRNYQNYSSRSAHAQSPRDITLQTGWSTTLTVSNTSQPPPPVKPGKLTAFDFSPRAVDSTQAKRLVHVVADFAKPEPTRVRVAFFGGSGHHRFGRAASLKPTTHGQWAGALKVGRWAGDVIATPELSASYGDGVKPEYRNISADRLAARHFPTQLKITSGTDTSKPVLSDLSVTPTSVDTTAGAQTVSVAATATDSGSGVRSVRVSFNHGGQGGFATAVLTRHGTQWTGQAKFRRCIPDGQWRIEAFVIDAAHNYASYRANELSDAGLPSQLSVQSSPGDTIAPEVANSTASGIDHTITLDFSEGVKNVSTSTVAVYAQKPASTRYRHPLSVSGITCSNGTTTVGCAGAGGLVTSARLVVPAVTGGDTYTVWANLAAVTPQLTDAAGNPLRWDYEVAKVTGS